MPNTYWTEAVLATLEEQNPWYRRSPASTRSGKGQEGVNVCGYFRDESGWGAAGRGYVRGLQAAGTPFSLLDMSEISSNRSGDRTLQGFGEEHPHAINLVCIDARQHDTLMQQVGEDFLDRYTIGAWAWELPRFPHKLHDRFAWYDEIWVGTSFIANTLAPISPVPVVRVPPVLTPIREGSRAAGRTRLGLSEDTFLYLFIFDFHSHSARKNPAAAIRAFRAAFAPDEDARLIIKCVNAGADPAGFQSLQDEIGEHPVSVLDGYWPASDIRDLMAGCDAYVSLHRSEGTGLTISDAMAAGKPAIATGWSGNMDFMDVANSFPVRYELTELTENVGPYPAGEIWAEPSVEHAAELMRYVYQNREDARARGERARRDIATHFSPEAIGRMIGNRLQVITHKAEIPAFRDEMRRYQAGYRTLAGRLRGIVERVVPPGATVSVISKGDEDLITFSDHIGWHFPRTEDGTYAGYHPADSAAAIAEIENACRRGSDILLFPATAYWWLEYYAELRPYLETAHQAIWHDESCAIFQLSPGGQNRLETVGAGERGESR